MSTSGVSELDMSSCSGSPSAYSESPHSSPLQQVPQLTSNFADSSCPGKRIYTFGTNGCKPYLSIIEQPQSHFRFRYDTEKSGSTHGCLLSKSYFDKVVTEKTFPTVELVNYHDEAIIKCSIKYQDNAKNLQQAYKILEDYQDHFSCKVPEKNSYKVVFRGIGIHFKKKTDLATLLYSKRSEKIHKQTNKVNAKELRAQCTSLSKSMKQNKVCLKFTAYTPDGKEICEPVYSNEISNTKSPTTNVLNICRMNAYSGKARGGEELFLLVDRIDKKDIEVHFFQVNEHGKKIWFERGFFIPNDVHQQCVIICSTPAYVDPRPLSDVHVNIQLFRPSDGSTSAPKPFIYKADEIHKNYMQHKRRKRSIVFPDASLHTPAPVRIVQPSKANTQFKHHINVIHQPIQQNASDSDFITTALDTVVDNLAHKTMLDPLQGVNVSQEIVVETQGDTSQTTAQLQGNIELQRAFDVYKTIQSQKTTEEQQEQEDLNLQETLGIYENVEITNTEETIDMQVTNLTDLHVIDESRGIVELLTSNGTHTQNAESGFLEGFNIDLQGAMGSDISSPMWGQVHELMNYKPQRVMAVPNTLATPDFNSMSMEEDLMSEEWFQKYKSCFDLLDAESNPKDKHPSFVSDSGRVRVEMRSSSTQTDEGEIENTDTGSSQTEGNESNASTSDGKNTNIENLGIITVREESEKREDETVAIKTEDNIKREENINDTTSENKIKLEEIPNKNIGFILCKYTGVDGEKKIFDQFKNTRKLLVYESVEEETSIDKTEAQQTPEQHTCGTQNVDFGTSSSGNMVAIGESDKVGGHTKPMISPNTSEDSSEQSKGEYPVEFSPADAAEVKKLLQELADLVRNKREGAAEVIRAKLQRLFDIRLSNGNTFLHMALFNNERSFQALVKIVHSVKMSHLLNYSNHRGETILHLALVHGSPQLVHMLVERGCSPMARTVEEDTCVHYAVRYGGEAGLRALLYAAARRRLPLQLDARNAEGCSALHLCALHAQAACARLLCERGAAQDARDAHRRTPLHLCAHDARADVASALLEHAAPRDVHACDARGRSPLAVVCARRPPAHADPELARLLLQHGARPPPTMARLEHLAPVLREFVTDQEFEELLEEAPSENESDEDSESYESAEDESIEAPECLASRLEELELFDDAESSSDLE